MSGNHWDKVSVCEPQTHYRNKQRRVVMSAPSLPPVPWLTPKPHDFVMASPEVLIIRRGNIGPPLAPPPSLPAAGSPAASDSAPRCLHRRPSAVCHHTLGGGGKKRRTAGDYLRYLVTTRTDGCTGHQWGGGIYDSGDLIIGLRGCLSADQTNSALCLRASCHGSFSIGV